MTGSHFTSILILGSLCVACGNDQRDRSILELTEAGAASGSLGGSGGAPSESDAPPSSNESAVSSTGEASDGGASDGGSSSAGGTNSGGTSSSSGGSVIGCSADSDEDGICDDEDVCVGDDTTGDVDADGVCDDRDQCTGDDAEGDADGDGVCEDVDVCVGDDADGDSDSDDVCDDIDQCDGDDSTGDSDDDAVCDDFDFCPGEADATGDEDGDGVCALVEALLQSTWAEATVTGTYVETRRVQAVDFDTDGDVDWVSSHLHPRRIVIWENAGAGSFIEAQATNTNGKPRSHTVIDLNGDDYLEVAYGGASSSVVSVVTNTAGFLGGETSLENTRVTSVFAMDVDGDDRDDLISYDSNNEELQLSLNTGLALSAPAPFDRVTHSDFAGPSYGAIELSGDGVIDLVVSTSESVGWYPNTGAGFGTYAEIAADGYNSTLQVADIDGDGLLDIVGVDSGVYWQRNLGGGAFSGRQLLVSGSWDYVRIADIDRDELNDVVVSDATPGLLAWSEQRNDGSFAAATTIATGTSPGPLDVGDFDGDDDIDIVWSDQALPGMHWYENPRF